ncbi:MAG: hypothetical protein HYV62_03475 [Candidatus Rokubacteria bacterium]|nr:hypothetical protein [Candidatus Rokubacteria bacterium]
MTTSRSGPSDPTTPGSSKWRCLLIPLACLTCAGQLPIVLAVLALTGWIGSLSLYFGLAAVILGAAFVLLLAWGGKALSAEDESGSEARTSGTP